MIHEFPNLPYAYDSLEPFIDEETMKVHHDKHHKAYFDKFVKAIEDNSELLEKPVEEILGDLGSVSEEIKKPVVNNGGGFYNHTFFWSILSKDKPFSESSEVGKAIIEKFGGFEKFKEEFSNAAATQFGSGWAWLVYDKTSNAIEIMQTSNQDCPLSLGKVPLIGIDVWEHAYYLKYQNKRPEYIENFFSVINWEKVEEIFVEVRG